MYLAYSLLLTIGFIALTPRFLIAALRHGKYVAGLRERLGKLPPIETGGRPVIWLHCVSVGEAQAARPLVDALIARFPSHCLVVSTTTLTGQKFARQVFSESAAAIFYFPVDWAWTVRRVLGTVNPTAVLLMETEIWPLLLRECRRRKIPVVLVNGRISERSFRNYKLLGRFIRGVVADLTVALMQSKRDAERIHQLGLPNDRVQVLGNLKFDSVQTGSEVRLTDEFRDRFGLTDDTLLIAAASTHEPEERIVCKAYQHLAESRSDRRLKLLIAPRRPERFEDIAGLLAKSELTWVRRSQPPGERDKKCEVILLDSIGELRAVYPLAAIVFVGGSIAPHGGHNMLEPASAGACVVCGAHTSNFAAITEALVENEAIVLLPDLRAEDAAAHLANVFGDLLAHEERRHEIARRAAAVCQQNQGAAARTVQAIAEVLATTRPALAPRFDSAPSAIASR
jgi:3-deoxy-D-manno-octulosonic-acid transferase